MKISGICLLLLILLMTACATTNSATNATPHNSRDSLDWDGVYFGVIPSASGSGIQVLIVLNRDYSFSLQYHYIDRDGSDLVVTGTFRWNEAGSIITLDTNIVPPYYQVGENFLRQLDVRGRVITGNLAENYILQKY